MGPSGAEGLGAKRMLYNVVKIPGGVVVGARISVEGGINSVTADCQARRKSERG